MDSGEEEGVRVEEEKGRDGLRRRPSNYVVPLIDNDEDQKPKRKGGNRAREKTAKEDDEDFRVEDANGGGAGLVKEKKRAKIRNRKDPITDQVEDSGSKPKEGKRNRARKRTKKKSSKSPRNTEGDRTKKVGIVDSEYIFHQGIQTLGESVHSEKKDNAKMSKQPVVAKAKPKTSGSAVTVPELSTAKRPLKEEANKKLKTSETEHVKKPESDSEGESDSESDPAKMSKQLVMAKAKPKTSGSAVTVPESSTAKRALKEAESEANKKLKTSSAEVSKKDESSKKPESDSDSEAFVKPVVPNGHDGYDEDDVPLVFKRTSNTAATTNRSRPNNAMRNSAIGSTKCPPPMRSPLTSSNRSALSGRSSMMKPTLPSPSSVQRSAVKSPLQDDRCVVAKERNGLGKAPSVSKSDDEDSEDDKPLSARLKMDSKELTKQPSSSGCGSSQLPVQKSNMRPQGVNDNAKKKVLDEKVPTSSTAQTKTNVGTSSSKPVHNEQKRPSVNNINQNGLKPKDEGHSSQAPGKRPLEKGSSSNQSSVKRPKLSEPARPVKMEQGSHNAATPYAKGKNLDLSKLLRANQATGKEDKSDDDDDDHVPIASRMRSESSNNKSSSAKPNSSQMIASSFRTIAKKPNKWVKASKYSKFSKSLPSGGGQTKWKTLEHNGVIFPPPYKRHGVKILYQGKPVDLTPEQEEVATMFAVMRETNYYNKPKFRENFWNDWRKLLEKNHMIKNLDDCDFTPIFEWYMQEKETKKQMTAEEKRILKEEKLKQEEKYMWAVLDGVRERIENFRVEPPGLFRGRGKHSKMGKVKNRLRPSDFTINIGKEAPIPECPIAGESWKEVKCDNTVTWLASWNDPINPKDIKYVSLAPSSSVKGQSDKEKYEKARKLHNYIGSIRAAYTKDFNNKDVTKRQIAVATYLIDKLALRAGNEKDDDEADTVGCCTLKVGNVECIPSNKLKFDFLGKDSIQYVNTVEVEPLVYKAIGQFQAGKSKTDDLFDELDTSKLNAHLKELMAGLTAKVFRTYNASITLDSMLSKETRDGDVPEKVVVYQQANKEVAIICNHQRTVSKSHGAQVEKLAMKIEELREQIKELNIDLDRAKKGRTPLMGSDGKRKRNLTPEALEKKIMQTQGKIEKMDRDMQRKEEMKTVALGTSKINYMDPRITVAWCKRHDVPIEKIFNKSLLAKFAWAMDVHPEFRFCLSNDE